MGCCNRRLRVGLLAAAIACVGCLTAPAGARGDAFERINQERLERVHAAVAKLAETRATLTRPGPYQEFRANLHVHSAFSHDSRGELSAIVAAAKRAGSDVLLFTEHPADHYDFVTDGHAGIHDGVLCIPGAETKGLLTFPKASMAGQETLEPADFARRVRQQGGLSFLSHLEERLDWQLPGLTGCEIYNTHADAKEETQLFASLQNPLFLLRIAAMVRTYPQETFSALQDDPRLYLDRWDELCQIAPHTGVSANDAHENVGVVIKLAADGKVAITDPLDDPLLTLDLALVRPLLPLADHADEGDELFRMQLDPYECSLRHVGTHLLARELTRESIEEALVAGRAFVAFDWIADARGFDCSVTDGESRHEMGSVVPWADGQRLIAEAPLPGHWRVIRNGRCIHEADGARLELPVSEPGNHRVELSLDVAGEPHLWVLTNPFYLQPPEPSRSVP
jgi:hypothetical protein